jgi:hypothetical protein
MPRVLVVNTGSSSIKYQLFEMPEGSGEPRRGAPVDREGRLGRDEALAAMLERYLELQAGGEPVHTWPQQG